jgi:hypothetical protein
VFNAANETAVAAFLDGRVPFGRISDTIEQFSMNMSRHPPVILIPCAPRTSGPGSAPVGVEVIVSVSLAPGRHPRRADLRARSGAFHCGKWAGIYVHRFSLGLGSPIPGSRKIGETEYRLLAPLGGYVKMATAEEGPTARPRGGVGDRAHTARPDVRGQTSLEADGGHSGRRHHERGVAWFAFVFLAAKNEQIDPVTRIGPYRGQPAPGAEALAAMHPGDSIVAIDDQPVHSWNEVQS